MLASLSPTGILSGRSSAVNADEPPPTTSESSSYLGLQKRADIQGSGWGRQPTAADYSFVNATLPKSKEE
jgi:hypothetical protein